jgi:hypothetical protein
MAGGGGKKKDCRGRTCRLSPATRSVGGSGWVAVAPLDSWDQCGSNGGRLVVAVAVLAGLWRYWRGCGGRQFFQPFKIPFFFYLVQRILTILKPIPIDFRLVSTIFGQFLSFLDHFLPFVDRFPPFLTDFHHF